MLRLAKAWRKMRARILAASPKNWSDLGESKLDLFRAVGELNLRKSGNSVGIVRWPGHSIRMHRLSFTLLEWSLYNRSTR